MPSPTYDVYLNGQMVNPDNANISIQDAGFQHGVGLFETFQVYHGKPFRLEAHLNRLASSARELGLADEFHTAPLIQAVEQTIKHNHLERARMRLTVTAGTLSLLKDNDGQPHMAIKRTVTVVPSEPTAYDPAYFTQGVTVRLHGPATSPFDITAGHKTLNYWGRLRSLRQAASVGAAETIWLNVTNHLASGAVSNLLLVKDGVLYSPFARGEEEPEALPAPVLPGITRATIFELAHSAGIDVQRKMLSVEELLDADELMLTNSGWGVLPVKAVEKKEIGSGQVGPVTAQLRESLNALIETETK